MNLVSSNQKHLKVFSPYELNLATRKQRSLVQLTLMRLISRKKLYPLAQSCLKEFRNIRRHGIVSFVNKEILLFTLEPLLASTTSLEQTSFSTTETKNIPWNINSVCFSSCVFLCLFLCLSLSLSVCLSLSVFLSLLFLSVCLSVCLSLSLSLSLLRAYPAAF